MTITTNIWSEELHGVQMCFTIEGTPGLDLHSSAEEFSFYDGKSKPLSASRERIGNKVEWWKAYEDMVVHGHEVVHQWQENGRK